MMATGHHRKRISKRRWKARLMLGRWIPRIAIEEHRLDRMIKRRGLNIEAQLWADYYRRAPWPAKKTT